MLSSIVSYPNRGPWGNSGWRGNTSGHLLRDWFLHIKPTGLVVDACKGSDTTGDVLRDLWREKQLDHRCRYVGLDLYEGFNMFKDNLLATLKGQRAQVVFAHPPYLDIVRYSRTEWAKVGKANGANPDDLSEVTNPEEFQAKMAAFMVNAYDALEFGGRTAILIGDVRKRGEYHCLASDLIQLGIGKLENVIVKAQHNCVSDSRQYAGNFIPIRHEWFLVWMKDRKVQSLGQFAVERSAKLSRQFAGTWRVVVDHALRQLGGKAHLKDIYATVFKSVDPGPTKHPEDRIRATLQSHFIPHGDGVWGVVEARAA